MRTVFISHANQDAQFAHRLATDLQRLGVQVWIASESIRPGEGWVSAIERGLEESSHVVVALTPAALESRWVKKETDIAIAQERKGLRQVIPLDVEPCKVPLLLSSYQMVSFRRDYDAGLSQLADILGVRVTPPFEPEMVLIPAGDFLMGSDPSVDKWARDDEQPQHTLSLPDYYLAKTPLTNAQYAAFVQATGHRQPEHWKDRKPPSGQEDHPVVYVSWYDAVAYCNWLSSVTGKPYRLPSETEWEKGARGTDGRIYPWGNQWDAERCHTVESGKGDTTPVGAYPQGASPYGLLDMAGNVWEWTRSLWGEDWEEPSFKYPYDPDDGREDLEAPGTVLRGWRLAARHLARQLSGLEAPGTVLRVMRGGSWRFSLDLARCVVRSSHVPNYSYFDLGFRLVSPVGSDF